LKLITIDDFHYMDIVRTMSNLKLFLEDTEDNRNRFVFSCDQNYFASSLNIRQFDVTYSLVSYGLHLLHFRSILRF